MDCHDCTRLADAWVDGELDPIGSADVERHLRDCPRCARHTGAAASLSAAVRAAPLYAPAPADLERRVRAALRREAGLGTRWQAPAARWGAIAAAVLLAGFVGWRLPRGGSDAANPLAAEVVSAHVRSLMADHLLDVVSTDRHTVKPWFAGKIDFAPEVRDCAAEGFALQGGRLDYLDGRPVAALVYRHEKHVINLFVWPSRGPAAPARGDSLNGFHERRWTDGRLTYWAVSDAAEATLRKFQDCVSRDIP